MDRWQLIRDERADVLVFLESLAAEQWTASSLCAGWSVKDVAVHLIVDDAVEELGVPKTLLKLAKWRFSAHRANAWWIEHNAGRSNESILAAFDKRLEPGRAVRTVGFESALRAAIIHHQDMRRPLGMPRAIPPVRLRAVLEAIVTVKGSINLGSRSRGTGLRLGATDVEWSHGEGPEVRGPGEAIMMALAGRGVAMAMDAGLGGAHAGASATGAVFPVRGPLFCCLPAGAGPGRGLDDVRRRVGPGHPRH